MQPRRGQGFRARRGGCTSASPHQDQGAYGPAVFGHPQTALQEAPQLCMQWGGLGRLPSLSSVAPALGAGP